MFVSVLELRDSKVLDVWCNTWIRKEPWDRMWRTTVYSNAQCVLVAKRLKAISQDLCAQYSCVIGQIPKAIQIFDEIAVRIGWYWCGIFFVEVQAENVLVDKIS